MNRADGLTQPMDLHMTANAFEQSMPAPAPEIVAEHGLKPEEYQRLIALLGRPPNLTELGIFSVMWSEHCSYKSSRVWLRQLPTEGPRVIQGPG
jgi:phosphoribosylformylglycinamidine synthase